MSKTPECPACKQQMEEGFVPDFTWGKVIQNFWHAGPPERSKFFGIIKYDNVKLEGSDLRKVATYRCPSCGLLQAYAP